jgi:FtsP/CotA-like multicopper oxidase with cupredoxin domain
MMMRAYTLNPTRKAVVVAAVAAFLTVVAALANGPVPADAQATPAGPAEGLVCTTSPDATFELTTATGTIGTADDNTVFMWGYTLAGAPFQHPSPVLCVDEGDTVTIFLENTLDHDVSIVFPGQDDVLADGVPAQPQFDGSGVMTSMTNVAPAGGGTIAYSFVASKPGTYLYQSGTDPEKQVRMGLFGMLVVRPDPGFSTVTGANEVDDPSGVTLTDTTAAFSDYLVGGTLTNDTDGSSCTIASFTSATLSCDAALGGGTANAWAAGDGYTATAGPDVGFAFQDVESAFNTDDEVMVLLSEIDPYLNQAVEQGNYDTFDMDGYRPRYWMINGRGFPDSVANNFASWLPAQPYGALARVYEQDTNQFLGDGVTPNPNYYPLPGLARYASAGTETVPFHPHGNNGRVIGRDGNLLRGAGGEDLSFERFSIPVGPGQTWDVIYKWYDAENYDPVTNPITVEIPNFQNVVYGMFYSGDPYLGNQGTLPVGGEGMNQCGEYYIISHNHALYQITSWGVPMTGPITYLRIDPPQPNSCS